MDNHNELEKYKRNIKDEIFILINNNQITEAKNLINEYEKIIKIDVEIYHAKSMIYILETKFDLAEKILKEAVHLDNYNSDSYYNLGYISYLKNNLKDSLFYYQLAKQYCKDQELGKDIDEILNNIKENLINEPSNFTKSNELKKVLVIAHIFPPLGGSGVQRTLKFVKYLQSFGWSPTVITVGESGYPLNDPQFLTELPNNINIIRVDEPKNASSKEIQEIINLYDQVINNTALMKEFINEFPNNKNLLLLPDSKIYWANEVLKNIENYININDFNMIYSTSGPYSDHIIGYILKQRYHKPWISDFRDEWTNNCYATYDTNSLSYRLQFAMEKSIVQYSDKVITTTPLSTENYINLFKLKREKVVTITNGYDEEDFDEIDNNYLNGKNGKFTIVHNGLFYSIRTPETFLNAVYNLIKTGKIDKEKISIHLTWSENQMRWMDYIRKLGLENVVHFEGYSSHRESLKLARSSDLLLLVVGPSEKSRAMYPGKIFEYLRLCKPILSLAPKDSVVENLINTTNRGNNVSFNDVGGIEEVLLDYYVQWLEGNNSELILSDKIKQFERKELTKNFATILNEVEDIFNGKKRNIAFFSIKGGDKFLPEIISELEAKFHVKKFIISDFSQIEPAMRWADICWFEWGDSLISYASKLQIAKEKKIICRIHRYEVFTENLNKIDWRNVDKLVLVTKHLLNLIEQRIPQISKQVEIEIIENGINLDGFNWSNRQKGYNLAFVGDINYRKNPFLLLQIMKKLVDINSNYKLFIAGDFTDPLIKLYFNHQIIELKLQNNIVFDGWQPNIGSWLEKIDYLLAPTIHESFGYFIGEAMASGIKPVIHNFPFADTIWPKEILFNTIDEAIEQIITNKYDSIVYRKYIEDRYSFKLQINKISGLIDKLSNIGIKENFDYKDYWNKRLDENFNIEGVGYLGLGTNYNTQLYKIRREVLERILYLDGKNSSQLDVLEFGPGIGIFTDFFNKKGVARYSAIDITEKSIKELEKKFPNYNFIKGDISAPSRLFNNSYDLIFAADVLLHLTDEQKYYDVIKNISQSLKSDGIAILYDPISFIGKKSENKHVVIRDITYVETLLSSVGLEIKGYIPTSFFTNHPFDLDVLGSNATYVQQIFNYIQMLFSNKKLPNELNEELCNWIFAWERLCLLNNKFGLSQKVLVIGKIENKKWIDIEINSNLLEKIWDRAEIEDQIIISRGKLNEYSNESLKELLLKLEYNFNKIETLI